MTKIYCDICGKEIYYDFDGVNLNFNKDKQSQSDTLIGLRVKFPKILKTFKKIGCL